MKKKTSKVNIYGTTARPRVCIFRSNAGIYAQAIDDTKGTTLCASSSIEIKEKKTPVETAVLVGENLSKKLSEKKIVEIVYDRNRYQYQGRVKALAEGIRKGGIKF